MTLRRAPLFMVAITWWLVAIFGVEFALLPPFFARTAKAATDDDEEEEDDEYYEDDEDAEEEEADDEDDVTDEDEDSEDEADDEEAAPAAKRRSSRGEYAVSGPVTLVVFPASTKTKPAAAEAEVAAEKWLHAHNIPMVDTLVALGGKHRLDAGKMKAKAEALMDEAKALYIDNDFDPAIEKLTEAEGELRSILGQPGVKELLLKALFMHGASLALNLDDELAQNVFMQILSMQSEAEVPAEYPDVVKDAFIEARQASDEINAGAISVSTRPDGVRVFVDGKYRGLSPLSLENVSPGPHTVMAESTGYWEAIKQVEVASEEKSMVSLDLTPAADYPQYRAAVKKIRRKFSHPYLYKQVKNLGRIMDSNEILAIRVGSKGGDLVFDAYVYNIDERAYKTKKSLVGASMNLTDEMANLLEVLLSDDTDWYDADEDSAPPPGSVVITETGEEIRTPGAEETPVYKTWWFWTIIGGVVVAAGAGVGTWLALRDTGGSSDKGGTIIIDF